MYAVIKTGGKQYRVAAEDVIEIERTGANEGDIVEFPVLMLAGEGNVEVGTPTVDGATVAGQVTALTRGPKIIIFKKRRRKHYRRKNGHRQDLMTVQITEILTGGKKPSKKAAAPAPKAEAKPAVKDDVEIIGGVGPALKKKLAAAGVTTLSQIAAMSAADMAKLDEDLKLGGRTEREEWVEQAKELLAGKPARAKVDQAKQ
ncbi:MAG: 50S ribosomal protein L21 [Anderseniella sp.]|jgi:large subunit ribosomal protein L21|nr:50S ribosomal protein L21 [Anderseniella sp.]